MGNNKEVRIGVVVDATLGSMKNAVDQLSNGLQQGVTKADTSKGLGAQLTKTIDKFRDEYANFAKLTQGNEVKFGDSKEAISSGEKLVKLYKEIFAQTGKIQNLSGMDLKKIFPDAFDSRVGELQGQMQSLQNLFLQIGEKQIKLDIATQDLETSKDTLERLKNQLIDTTMQQEAYNQAQQQTAASKLNLDASIQEAERAEQAFDEAKLSIEQLRESFRQQINLNLSKIEEEVSQLDSELDQLKQKKEALEASGDKKGAAAVGKQITATEGAKKAKEAEYKKVQSAAAKVQTAKPEKLAELASATSSDLNKQTEALTKAQAAYGKYTSAQEAASAASAKEAIARKEHTAAMGREEDALQELRSAEKTNEGTAKQIAATTDKIKTQEEAVRTLTTQIEGLKTKLSTKGGADLKELIPDFDEQSLKTKEGVDEIIAKLQQLDDQRAEELINELRKIDTSEEDVASGAEEMKRKIQQVDDGAKDVKKTGQEIENLKNQVMYFFSMTNGVQLFKRAVTQAMNVVKELDATMTEAAVVTDFSVGDMWDKLPQYADEAQKLGVSINGMYQATTLYYQQGLKTNQAMELGIETMKMAKIAGIESSEATKAMTAALRGFNMELNETSATKVNDVYSQLAAVTAADVSQISTAMEKTASIAASANMELETTAAFLAQIIETTQEAPETAGTAMKTIIARFSEVKSLREQGKTTGEDEEGEGIDVNRIQTALATVGISMNDFFAGTEGLDSILLKLAEKWEGLDFETQRYIATMAAGSRQQSRFIAMMSDYSRTTELVNQATNSAGASQKQFEKTMDSLEYKLQQLENAWNTFLMGLTNNEIIKAGVDALVFLLNTINKLIDGISGGNGLIKSIVSLGLAIAGLSAGRAILSSLLGGIGAALSKGIFNEATKSGIIKESATTGATAGKTMGQSMAAGMNASSNALLTRFKITKAGLVKEIKSIPSITIKENTRAAQVGIASLQTSLQKLSAQETLTNEQQKYKAHLLQKLASCYSLEGAAAAGLTATQQGLVVSRVLDNKVTTEQLALMGPQTMALYAQALANGDLTTAELLEAQAQTTQNNLRAGGLTALLTSIGLIAMETTATDTQTVSIWASIKAKWEEFKTQLFLNSAMIIGTAIVLAYVAAIALLVIGIVKWVEAAKKADNANAIALEEANERIQEFSKQAENAKQTLEDMANEKDNLDQLRDSFAGLAKGTAEWRKKLVEVNSEVLDLVNKYPTLAAHVERGVNGELTINDAGWNMLEEQMQTQYNNALANQQSAQLYKTEVEQQVAVEKANSQISGAYSFDEFVASRGGKAAVMGVTAGVGGLAGAIAGTTGGAAIATKLGAAIGTAVAPGIGTAIGAIGGLIIGGLAGGILGHIGVGVADLATSEDQITRNETGMSKEDYLKFAAAAQEAGLTQAGGSSKEQYQALFEQMGFDKTYNFETLYGNIAELGDRFDELSASAYSLQTQQDAYTRSFISTAGENLNLGENREQIENITAFQTEDLSDQIAEKTNEMLEDKSYVDRDGNATDQLISEYASYMNMTEDQVRAQLKSEELSAQTMASALATQQVQDEVTQKLKDVSKNLQMALNMVGKDKQESLKRLTSENGKDMIREDLKVYKQIMETTTHDTSTVEGQNAVVDEVLKQMYGKTSAELGLDPQVFWESMFSASSAFSGFEDLAKKLDVKGFDNISAGSAKMLADAVEDQMSKGGSKEGATTVMNQVASLTGELSIEDAETFINLFTSMDWSNTASVEDFSEKLASLGSNFEAVAKKVEGLEDNLKDFANSSYKHTTEEKYDILSDSRALIDKIREGATEFTKDEWDLFSEGMQKNFIQTENGTYSLKNKNLTSFDLINDVREFAAQNVLQGDGERSYNLVKSWEGTTFFDHRSNYAPGYAEVQQEIGDERYKNTVEYLKGGSYYDKNGNLDLSVFYNEASWDYFKNNGGDGAYQFYKKYINKEGGFEDYRTYISDLLNSENGTDKLETFLVASELGEATPRLQEMYNANGGALFKQNYRWHGDTSKPVSLDWMMEQIATGTNFQYNTEGKTHSVDNVITNDTIDRVFEIVAPGAEVDSQEEKVELIKQIYTEHKNRYEDLKAADFYTHYLGADLDTLYADLDHNFDKQAQGARDVLNTLVASTPGIEAQIDLWKGNNEALKGYDNELAILALKQNDAYKSANRLGTALEKNIEALSKGPSAGEEYTNALDDIQDAMSLVFGKKLSTKSIEALIPIFQKISAGGETAKEAVASLSRSMFEASLDPNLDVHGSKSAMAWYDTLMKEMENGPVDFDQFVSQINDPRVKEEFIKTIQESPLFSLAGEGERQILSMLSGEELVSALGGDITDQWRNSYDRFYNTLERINEQLRIRERLEKQYQRMLKDSNSNVEDLTKNKVDRLKTLEGERSLQSYLASGKSAEIDKFMKENAAYSKFVTGYDHETGKIQIDWAAIDAVKGSDTGAAIEEYISTLEGLRDQEQDALDALYGIDDEIEDIKDEGKDEYLELENRIKDALIQQRQDEIDKLNEINDSINDTNSELLSAMQDQIAEYRQARDNEDTETELADKQRRLMYLQQDTSGANAMEILSLQKEIDEGTQDYTDTLIDQKISELQQQNDRAAEQRERQIAIMEQQLTHYEESGQVWEDVKTLWQSGIGSNGIIIGSDLGQLLMGADGWQKMSQLQKEDWANELITNTKAAASWEQLKDALLEEGDDSVSEEIKNAGEDVVEGLTDKENVDKGEYNVEVKLDLTIKLELEKPERETLPPLPTHTGPGVTVRNQWEAHMVPITNRDDKLSYTAYSTGGLADSTGPAWLDGTKSRPEYVLNAEQTQAFFSLVDILESLKAHDPVSTQKSGDNNYDIDINVESIGSDYDIEQMAEKIKGLIVDHSRYRNNNTL